jgi:hypothetical protein
VAARAWTWTRRLARPPATYGPHAVDLELAFAADFADVFEVRGTRRERRGAMHVPVLGDSSVALAYTDLDGLVRRTGLGFDHPHPRPSRSSPSK